MSYCINFKCDSRYNQDNEVFCSTCGTPLLIENPLLIGKKYRLLRPLRELAERGDTEIFEVDAGGKLKVLKVLQNPNLLPWFEREAEILRRLDYPGIIPHVERDGYFPFELDERRKLYCLVMEKLEGQTLEQWLEKKKSISQSEAIEWLKQLIDIIGILHKNKLFHRDIKLSNIILKPDGKLALIDFGTVREKSVTYQQKYDDRREMTAIVSPGYSPLEQVNGRGEERSDFYALGRCFVHLLTGVHPLDFFEDEQTGKLIWYDSYRKDNILQAKWIKDLIAFFSSEQDYVYLRTDVHPLSFSKDKQTSKSNKGNSAPKIDTWLAKLIDYLIEPIADKRPEKTEDILEPLQRKRAYWQEQRLSQTTHLLLKVLNIGICIILVIKFGFYLHDKQEQGQPDSNKQENRQNENAQNTK